MRPIPGRSILQFAAFFTLAILFFQSCKPDPCEDVICNPCENSKLVITYEDSLGNCDPMLHANGMVYAFGNGNWVDTLFSYDFADSCTPGFLIDTGIVYLVQSGAWVNDTVRILDFEFQEPVEVTECCLCYPVEHADVMINGDSNHVEFPAGDYQNTPLVRVVN